MLLALMMLHIKTLEKFELKSIHESKKTNTIFVFLFVQRMREIIKKLYQANLIKYICRRQLRELGISGNV
jgi:hypothetical protein